ncbi:MAG: Gfo/Idh/MocA family oxidoreductase [candidate division WOR-3 bacterium]
MDCLALAVVGLGRWGMAYCRTLGLLDCCELVAAVDSSPSARERAVPILRDIAPKCRVLADISALVNGNVDAAIVATPPDTHYQIAERLLTAGLDVMVEKPMTISFDEALRLSSVASHYHRLVAVGHTPIFTADFQRAFRTCYPLRSSLLLARRTSNGSAVFDSAIAFYSVATPAVVLWDLAPHDIAMAIKLAGEPETSWCRANGQLSVEYFLRFANGVIMKGLAAWRKRSIRQFRIVAGGSVIDIREPLEGEIPFEELPLTRQCREFAAACKHRRALASGLSLGVATVRVLERLSSFLATYRRQTDICLREHRPCSEPVTVLSPFK